MLALLCLASADMVQAALSVTGEEQAGNPVCPELPSLRMISAAGAPCPECCRAKAICSWANRTSLIIPLAMDHRQQESCPPAPPAEDFGLRLHGERTTFPFSAIPDDDAWRTRPVSAVPLLMHIRQPGGNGPPGIFPGWAVENRAAARFTFPCRSPGPSVQPV